MRPLRFKCECTAENDEVIITPPEGLVNPLEFRSIHLIVDDLSEQNITLAIASYNQNLSNLLSKMIENFEAKDPSNEMETCDFTYEDKPEGIFFQAEFTTKPFELENEELYKIINDFFASCLSQLEVTNNFKIKLNDCINKVMKTQGVSFVKFEEKPSIFPTAVPAPAIVVAMGELVQLDL